MVPNLIKKELHICGRSRNENFVRILHMDCSFTIFVKTRRLWPKRSGGVSPYMPNRDLWWWGRGAKPPPPAVWIVITAYL
jgi:hypothetical protein